MSLVQEKTWQFSVNTRVNPGGGMASQDASRDTWLKIKQALVGFASSPWVVRASSGGNGGGGLVASTGDNWQVLADVVGNSIGNAHSWIVLRQTGIFPTFDLCIEFDNGYAQSCHIYHAWGGYNVSSPVTTARPSVNGGTVEVDMGICALNEGYVCSLLHAMQSTDGKCTRVLVAEKFVVFFAMFFDVPKTPSSGWTHPYVAYLGNTGSSSSGSILTFGYLNESHGFVGYVPEAATLATFFLGAEGHVDYASTKKVSCPEGETLLVPVASVGIVSETAGCTGWHGGLFDMYWAPSYLSSGTFLPGDGKRGSVVLGNVVLPWSGDAINLY